MPPIRNPDLQMPQRHVVICMSVPARFVATFIGHHMPSFCLLERIVATALLSAVCVHAADPQPLLKTANFGGKLTTEESKFLRLVADPGQMVSLYARLPVTGLKALKLTYSVRYTDVKRGEKPWFDARIMLDFKDAAGLNVQPKPPAPYYTGSSTGWRKESLSFAVPETAATLSVMPALFQAASGTMDLDDLQIIAIDPATLPAVAKDVTGAAVVEVDAHGQPPAVLHVDGKNILTPDNKEVWLQGVAVPSLEWTNGGEETLASIVTAVTTWKANIIRLPVMDERWYGKKNQTDGGAAYRALIDQAVLAASSRGAYLIIDLHRYRAATDDMLVFWKDVADLYKDNPAVIFGVLNEPHDITWDLWRNGGDVTNKKKDNNALAENKEVITSFHSPGLQAMVAAIRATGAKNLIIAGGLDWAYDLSGIINGFALDDLGGNGIVYDAHVYPWKSDWQHKFLDVAKIHPVLLGEVGCDKVRYDFIPPERFESPYTWAPDILACIQTNKLHWTAWAFHPKCGPPMLLDTKDFTPSPFWGSYVRVALLGGRFQSNKLR